MEGCAAELPVEVGDFVHEQMFHIAHGAVLLEDDVDEIEIVLPVFGRKQGCLSSQAVLEGVASRLRFGLGRSALRERVCHFLDWR